MTDIDSINLMYASPSSWHDSEIKGEVGRLWEVDR